MNCVCGRVNGMLCKVVNYTMPFRGVFLMQPISNGTLCTVLCLAAQDIEGQSGTNCGRYPLQRKYLTFVQS